jgi:hypothetical protein
VGTAGRARAMRPENAVDDVVDGGAGTAGCRRQLTADLAFGSRRGRGGRTTHRRAGGGYLPCVARQNSGRSCRVGVADTRTLNFPEILFPKGFLDDQAAFLMRKPRSGGCQGRLWERRIGVGAGWRGPKVPARVTAGVTAGSVGSRVDRAKFFTKPRGRVLVQPGWHSRDHVSFCPPHL